MQLDMDGTHPDNMFAGGYDQTKHIRRITIYTSDPYWDFAIFFETAYFPGVGSFDPWRQLIYGNKVVADPALLATLEHPPIASPLMVLRGLYFA
jgi:hypothetical protein